MAIREGGHPSGRIPGVAAPAKSGGQVLPSRASAPAVEPAFRSSLGRSTNKTPVRGEQAFRTRGGKGNGS